MSSLSTPPLQVGMKSHYTVSSIEDWPSESRINYSILIAYRCWRSSKLTCLSATTNTGSGNMRRVQPNRLVEQNPLWQHQLVSRKHHRPLGWPKIPAPPEKTLVMSWVLMENLPKQKRSSTISRSFACTAGAPLTNMICSVGSRTFLQAILPHWPLLKRFQDQRHCQETDK